jgi:hypothetical protein
MNALRATGVLVLISWGLLADSEGSEEQLVASTNAIPEMSPAPALPRSNLWQRGIGEGFSSAAQTLSVEAGIAPGIATFGGREAHDLALLSLSYGHMLGGVIGEGHWYRGNFELRGELFGGGQYSPSSEWVIGLTPHLRYNFATSSRWIPFLDAGAGFTATGIGPPDLSGTFEFNLQGGTGVQWFFHENLAFTSEVKYLHMSCGGLHHPNLGVNNVAFIVGLTWSFGK